MKVCPFCKEEIRDEAIKCRYCQSSVLPVQPASDPSSTSPMAASSAPVAEKGKTVLIVDDSIIFFGKFVAGALAIFVTIGIFLYGFDIKQSLKDVETSTQAAKSAADSVGKIEFDVRKTQDQVKTDERNATTAVANAKASVAALQQQLEDVQAKYTQTSDAAKRALAAEARMEAEKNSFEQSRQDAAKLLAAAKAVEEDILTKRQTVDIAVAHILSINVTSVSGSSEPPSQSPTSPPIPKATRDWGIDFDGIESAGTLPAYSWGAVGPRYYVQTAGDEYVVYDKQGNPLIPPTSFNALWKSYSGLCATGDLLASTVLYDNIADRWLLAHTSYQGVHSVGQNPEPIGERECIAMSKSPDPIGGGWNFYDFELTRSSDSIVDYPRIAMSPAGYYMTGVVFNQQHLEGSRIWLFERSAMLQGHRGRLASVSTGDAVLIPASVNGTLAPTDVLGFVLRMVKKQDGSGKDRLEILGLHNDWSPGGRASIGPVASFEVEPFEALDCECIPQPGTSIQLDGLGDRLMSPVEYRNFGSYETLLATHSVKMTHGSGSTAGMRWYELRRPAGGQWSLFQQGTVESSDVNRWMGSIAMDGAGNIALGYNVASKTIYPGIRYSARLFTDPGGQMPRGETILFNGLGSQATQTRWGGYTSMTADPVAPCLFWYTAEYLPASGDFNWHTRIANFRITGCDDRMAK